LVEHDHVVEELSSAATDPAFRNGVLPGATIGGPARVGSQRLDEPDDGGVEDRVSVEDEMRRRCVEGKRLPKLLALNDHDWEVGLARLRQANKLTGEL
jgi:hypothetical protein